MRKIFFIFIFIIIHSTSFAKDIDPDTDVQLTYSSISYENEDDNKYRMGISIYSNTSINNNNFNSNTVIRYIDSELVSLGFAAKYSLLSSYIAIDGSYAVVNSNDIDYSGFGKSISIGNYSKYGGFSLTYSEYELSDKEKIAKDKTLNVLSFAWTLFYTY